MKPDMNTPENWLKAVAGFFVVLFITAFPVFLGRFIEAMSGY